MQRAIARQLPQPPFQLQQQAITGGGHFGAVEQARFDGVEVEHAVDGGRAGEGEVLLGAVVVQRHHFAVLAVGGAREQQADGLPGADAHVAIGELKAGFLAVAQLHPEFMLLDVVAAHVH